MNFQNVAKVELHRHLELSLRASTIRELAPSVGIFIKDEADFAQRFLILHPMTDLGSVLNKFMDTQKLLNSEEVLERIAFEACEDAYLHEAIHILELRYAPTFIQVNHPHLSFEKIHQAIVRGMERAEREFPIVVGLICIIQRILSVDQAAHVTDFAIEHRETFVGLDLADNEIGFDSKPFAPLFLRAKKAGLHITIHSGEAVAVNAPRYVREAMDHLGAERIGHGVQICHDLNTMIYVREKKIPLELCLTSNFLTQAVPDLSAHPFRQLMEFGIVTTLNADDPGIFNTDLTKEIERAQSMLGVTNDQVFECLQNAALHSFIPLNKRQKVWPKMLTR